MKVKTDELKGVALDWAVAKCEDLLGRITQASTWGELCKARGGIVFTHGQIFSPSTNWTLGGPLLDREKIQVTPLNQDNPKYGWAAAYKARGEYGEDFYSRSRQRGITPLVAAMRCFVTAKLGAVVDVPDVLLESEKSVAHSVESDLISGPVPAIRLIPVEDDSAEATLGWPDFLDAPMSTDHPDYPAEVALLQKVEHWLTLDRTALIRALIKAEGEKSHAKEAAVAVRVEGLEGLKQRAGAAYTLWQVGFAELNAAGGDASKVNWSDVNSKVIGQGLSKGQALDTIVAVLLEYSPGAVDAAERASLHRIMADLAAEEAIASPAAKLPADFTALVSKVLKPGVDDSPSP